MSCCVTCRDSWIIDVVLSFLASHWVCALSLPLFMVGCGFFFSFVLPASASVFVSCLPLPALRVFLLHHFPVRVLLARFFLPPVGRQWLW